MRVADSAFSPQTPSRRDSYENSGARVGSADLRLARDGTHAKPLYATRAIEDILNLVVKYTMLRNACHRVPMGSVDRLVKRARPTLEAVLDNFYPEAPRNNSQQSNGMVIRQGYFFRS